MKTWKKTRESRARRASSIVSGLNDFFALAVSSRRDFCFDLKKTLRERKIHRTNLRLRKSQETFLKTQTRYYQQWGRGINNQNEKKIYLTKWNVIEVKPMYSFLHGRNLKKMSRAGGEVVRDATKLHFTASFVLLSPLIINYSEGKIQLTATIVITLTPIKNEINFNVEKLVANRCRRKQNMRNSWHFFNGKQLNVKTFKKRREETQSEDFSLVLPASLVLFSTFYEETTLP